MTEDAHDLVCSGCGGPRDTAGRYCRDCRRRYMREWRKRQTAERAELEAELLAAAYGKDVPRETIERLEKRSKRLP